MGSWLDTLNVKKFLQALIRCFLSHVDSFSRFFQVCQIADIFCLTYPVWEKNLSFLFLRNCVPEKFSGHTKLNFTWQMVDYLQFQVSSDTNMFSDL